MEQFERYWLFAIFCLVLGISLIRLVFRERITLQSSLWFLGLLGVLLVFALVPGLTVNVAEAMGFALPSNFFFAAGIGTLGLLHLHTLITLSRTELRSITLTQEVGLLREQVERLLMQRSQESPGSNTSRPKANTEDEDEDVGGPASRSDR